MQVFSITLRSPFSARPSEPEQEDPRAWVWIMAGIGDAVLLLAAILFFRRKRGAL